MLYHALENREANKSMQLLGVTPSSILTAAFMHWKAVFSTVWHKSYKSIRASWRLRVVPLSLSPSRVTREETTRKNQDFARFSFASRTTDWAKEGLLVVYLCFTKCLTNFRRCKNLNGSIIYAKLLICNMFLLPAVYSWIVGKGWPF